MNRYETLIKNELPITPMCSECDKPIPRNDIAGKVGGDFVACRICVNCYTDMPADEFTLWRKAIRKEWEEAHEQILESRK